MFNIKDFLEDNIHYDDINSFRFPNLVKVEIIGIGFAIAIFVTLVLQFLVLFNIIDIHTIVEAMQQCVI